MGDYYRQFLSSMSGAEGHPAASPDETKPVLISGVAVPMASPQMPGTYANVGYFQGFPEQYVLNASKSQKGTPRRKSGVGHSSMDQVKHRRTRSGCFTCRTRRVKCDETRPICERCKKGKRECTYPEPPSSKCNSGQASKTQDGSSSVQHASPMSSNEGEEDEGEQEQKLETIPDEEEPDDLSRRGSTSAASQTRRPSTTSSSIALSAGRQNSETPSHEINKSASPSASTVTTTRSWTPAAHQTPDLLTSPGGRLDWSHLPPDLQRHLNFFVDNITNYHYSLAVDEDDFFNTILPNIAVRCEPLLNAVVGFSAYHVTLQNPTGKLQDFLQYYNRSVTQLLSILKRKEAHNVPVLMTILQLATIEEYLGDWVNLMGHQKAAFEIITQIFTPQTAMQFPIGRMCLSWYARFDTTVALMGGFPTEIPREWFTTMVGFYQSQMASNPDLLRWKIEDRAARLRLISYDMSILYARGSREQISQADYDCEHEQLSKQLEDWKNTWDPALSDQRYLITDFTWRRPVDPNDIVNPYTPGILYDRPLFNSTVVAAEWHSSVVMHKSQSSNTSSKQLFEELASHAFSVCQHFETIELWPSAPAGALIAIQPCISIAALFLPHYPSNNMWLRRKFALLETMGHIHPGTRRVKMAEIFRDPSCAQWWLPNNEGFTPILQSIRSFADERNTKAVNAQQENLREMKHLFAKLGLNEHEMDRKGKGIDGRT